MDDQIPRRAEIDQIPLPRAYEPPRIELVLTREDLEREAMYTGPGGSPVL